MTPFRFRAARVDGSVERGLLAAASQSAARELLIARGLYPLALDETRTERARSILSEEMSAEDLSIGLRSLATILESGLSMSGALRTVAGTAVGAWTAVLPRVEAAVREGQSLSSALRAQDGLVPPVVLGLLEAGEASGQLAAAVLRAADVTEQHAEMRRALRSALAYPLLLAVAAAASTGLLVVVVLPRFAEVLTGLGRGLPRSTTLLLTAAEGLRHAALPGLCVAIALMVAWRAWTASERGLRRWHELLRGVPLVGPIRFAAATARGAETLAALLVSGVPMASALQYAAAALGDAGLRARLLAARQLVMQGASLASAAGQHAALTPTVLQLIRAGEASGRLPAMLSHGGKMERMRAELATRAAVRLLEPALILTFAALVALIAAAMLQAMYSIRPAA